MFRVLHIAFWARISWVWEKCNIFVSSIIAHWSLPHLSAAPFPRSRHWLRLHRLSVSVLQGSCIRLPWVEAGKSSLQSGQQIRSQSVRKPRTLLLARPPSLQTQATLQLWFHLELHKAETALALSLTRPLSSPPFPSPLPTRSSWEKPGATEAEIVLAVLLLSPLELVRHFPLLGSFALSPFHLLFQFLAFQFKSHQRCQNCTVQIIMWKMSSSVYRIGNFSRQLQVMRTWLFVCCVASLKNGTWICFATRSQIHFIFVQTSSGLFSANVNPNNWAFKCRLFSEHNDLSCCVSYLWTAWPHWALSP